MRFVDVRNLLGKAFCNYLLTLNEIYRKNYQTLEVPEEFVEYKSQRVAFYKTFIEKNKKLLPPKDCPSVLLLGKELNNGGYYFEAHEVVEKYWLNYKGEHKKFLQAFIQVAIANMHLESGNLRGYQKMKVLALKNLENFKGEIFGIDTDKLKESLKNQSGFILIP